VALLGDAAADGGGGGGTTDSVSAAAESKPRCDSRPHESPLPETTVSNGGYTVRVKIIIFVTTTMMMTLITLQACQLTFHRTLASF